MPFLTIQSFPLRHSFFPQHPQLSVFEVGSQTTYPIKAVGARTWLQTEWLQSKASRQCSRAWCVVTYVDFIFSATHDWLSDIRGMTTPTRTRAGMFFNFVPVFLKGMTDLSAGQRCCWPSCKQTDWKELHTSPKHDCKIFCNSSCFHFILITNLYLSSVQRSIILPPWLLNL